MRVRSKKESQNATPVPVPVPSRVMINAKGRKKNPQLYALLSRKAKLNCEGWGNDGPFRSWSSPRALTCTILADFDDLRLEILKNLCTNSSLLRFCLQCFYLRRLHLLEKVSSSGLGHNTNTKEPVRTVLAQEVFQTFKFHF